MSEIDDLREYTYSIEIGEEKFKYSWSVGATKRLALKYGSLKTAFDKFSDSNAAGDLNAEAIGVIQDFIAAGLESNDRDKDAERIVDAMSLADLMPMVELISHAIKESSSQAKGVKKNPTK